MELFDHLDTEYHVKELTVAVLNESAGFIETSHGIINGIVFNPEYIVEDLRKGGHLTANEYHQQFFKSRNSNDYDLTIIKTEMGPCELARAIQRDFQTYVDLDDSPDILAQFKINPKRTRHLMTFLRNHPQKYFHSEYKIYFE